MLHDPQRLGVQFNSRLGTCQVNNQDENACTCMYSTVQLQSEMYNTVLLKYKIKLALNCCLSNDYPVQNSTFNKWLSFIEIYYL